MFWHKQKAEKIHGPFELGPLSSGYQLPVTISHIPYTTSDATSTSSHPPLALMMPNFKGSTAQGISISCLRARVGLLDYTRPTPLTPLTPLTE